MFRKFLKICILCALFSLLLSFAAFSAESFPFELVFDTDEVGHLCYAGHKGASVKYREGVMILPETSFSVTAVAGSDTGYNIESLSAAISLTYESETGGSAVTEVLRTYAEGSLNTENSFPFLGDNIIANLEERGLLYSDALSSLYVTLKCPGRPAQKQVIYLYVSDEDEFYEALDAVPDEEYLPGSSE